MRTSDAALIGAYTLASTAAIMMIKQYARPAMEAWRLSPGPSSSLVLLALGAALYGLSFLLWMFILSRTELSLAYPVVIGATLMATTLGSWLMLKEPVHALRLAGIAVIFLGVLVVARN